MPTRITGSWKGRDLRALNGFRDRVRSALGKRLSGLRVLGRRALEVPPEAALPRRAGAGAGAAGGLALQPVPEPPGELQVAVMVERRDLWVEDQVDAASLDVALETGALVLPLILAQEELASESARVGPLAARLAQAEELT